MFKFILIAAFVAYVSAAPAVEDVHAEIIHQKSDVRPDGFDTLLETSNHIHQVASGDEHGFIHGKFSWISPEGQQIEVDYVANDHGYQPSGLPEAILKSIAHPQNEEHHK